MICASASVAGCRPTIARSRSELLSGIAQIAPQSALIAQIKDPSAHHRAAGDLHHQALRALGNRLVGILHGCLRHHTAYSETTAWAHRQTTQAA